jgi:hypothetical protein
MVEKIVAMRAKRKRARERAILYDEFTIWITNVALSLFWLDMIHIENEQIYI